MRNLAGRLLIAGFFFFSLPVVHASEKPAPSVCAGNETSGASESEYEALRFALRDQVSPADWPLARLYPSVPLHTEGLRHLVNATELSATRKIEIYRYLSENLAACCKWEYNPYVRADFAFFTGPSGKMVLIWRDGKIYTGATYPALMSITRKGEDVYDTLRRLEDVSFAPDLRPSLREWVPEGFGRKRASGE